MGSGKNRWKILFHKSPSTILYLKKESQIQQPISIPHEFLCPISNSIMADPVIVPSGHTFERNCVMACVSLTFTPPLPGAANFSTVIPNLALKSTILNWCDHHLIDPPKPIDFHSAKKIVISLIESGENHSNNSTPASEVSVTSSDGSITVAPTRCSSSSSCDNEILTLIPTSISISPEEEELLTKLRSSQIIEQEEALISLRKLTRTHEDTRLHLCTPRLLSSLKSLIPSRNSSLQVNAVALLVNLSLEKLNKVKIVRSGIVPPLIEVLRNGFPESQEHAAGALFSLSLDDQNKTAIGVLGAIPPLLNSLRSVSERTRHDSATALFHLSLVQSNRVKMIKLGSVQVLLGMVKSGHMLGRVMLILCKLAGSVEGRAAMLDSGAVECFVNLLVNCESGSIFESCLSAFYGLSYGGLRFKGLAKDARAEVALERIVETVSVRGKDYAIRILEVLRKRDEEEEEIDWEELLNDEDDRSRTKSRVGGRNLSRSS